MRPSPVYTAARLVLATLVALALVASASAAAQSPLDRAHAHNDYAHARPLHDALDRGFGSVEVDIWLVDGALLVAHARDSVRADRTLEGLYLAPLRAHVASRGGQVHAQRPPLTLLIDIKSHADSTWAVLAPLLARYDDVFTAWRGDSMTVRPVVAVLSGKRPIATVRAARERWAALDGRLDDLTARGRPPAAAMPLVSDDWEKVTTWRGVGAVPRAVRRRVAQAVAQAHAQGRKLRFWNTPDTPVVWQLLAECGVDLIGADDLEGLRAFLGAAASATPGARRP